MSQGSPETDRAALVRTPFAFRPLWRQMRMYPMSTWSGVEVNSWGRVIKLDLRGKDIKCVFPEELCELYALQELILHTNRIYGTLPSCLRDLKALEILDLWDNFFHGPIPVEIAQLTQLRELHLSGNFFMGPIPKELGRLSKLTALYLHGNKLEGLIPAELGQLRSLQKLVLINNRLSGSIPVELAKLKSLVDLNLANNRLSGAIPAELGQLSNLMTLYLWGNNLSGSIPEELGQLSLLEKLDLAQNQLLMSGGGIPLSLRRHRNFRRFVFAVPGDGAPIPLWRSKCSVIPALALGYLDLLSDVFTALSYYQESRQQENGEGRGWWFVLSVVFIAAPSAVAGLLVFRSASPIRRLAVTLQMGLLCEAYVSFREQSYSHVLVALRVIQPLFRSLPQLLLQTYALLVSPGTNLGLRLFSAVMSATSLSFAATAIIVEHPLSQLKWGRGVAYPSAKFWRASEVFFSTVQYVGSVIVRGGFRVHPQDYVWWFLGYQALEIVGRVVSLAVLALVAEFYFFVVLAWLWFTRWFISTASIGVGAEQEMLRFRALLRVVGMPLMDSLLDRVTAYKVSCALTLLETVVFLSVGNAYSPAMSEGKLADRMRRVFTVVSIMCTAGKLCMAIALVVPFKEKIGRVAPAETGELRVDNDEEDPVFNSRGGNGGVGDSGGGRGKGIGATGQPGEEQHSIRVLWRAISVERSASLSDRDWVDGRGEKMPLPPEGDKKMEAVLETFSPALVEGEGKMPERGTVSVTKPPIFRKKLEPEAKVDDAMSASCTTGHSAGAANGGQGVRGLRASGSESGVLHDADEDGEAERKVTVEEEKNAASERAPVSHV